jgi:membrane protein YdbS with pleckstrin-like domain
LTFANVQVPLQSLPQFSAVEFLDLDPRYPRVVLGVALVFQIVVLILVTLWLFAVMVPKAGLPMVWAAPLYCLVIGLFIFHGWFMHKSASVIRYAIREHDVIVQSGVFWRKETVQPIRRIQHVEQHQGPVDKRYGLYELKLFSAGTGHFTFRIPGLTADAAARIRQFILDVQQDGWSDDSKDGHG